jgi:predicted Fe-Mo cluster-binding NifX family protein
MTAGGKGEVCVAIPTDDGLTVKLGHFGDGKFYFHYVYRNGRWLLKRCIENPYAGHHSHDEAEEEKGKRPKILAMQQGCDVLVAVAFGPGGEEFMKKHGLKVVKVKPRTTIKDALEEAARMLGLAGGQQQ